MRDAGASEGRTRARPDGQLIAEIANWQAVVLLDCCGWRRGAGAARAVIASDDRVGRRPLAGRAPHPPCCLGRAAAARRARRAPARPGWLLPYFECHRYHSAAPKRCP